MAEKIPERRKFERYGSNAEVSFKLLYDVQTQIKYQIIDTQGERILSKKYQGVSQDVSAEGLRFTCSAKLNKGDILRVEVFTQGNEKPVVLDAEVRWCRPNAISSNPSNRFEAGIKVVSVNSKVVAETIRFDKIKGVVWSEVLESLLKNILEGDRPTKS